MEILKWSILSLMTFFIGCVAGFGFSSRKVVISWLHIMIIFVLAYMVSLSSSFLGHLMGPYISFRFLEILIGLGLVLIGIMLAISKPIYPGHKDIMLFTVAIQLDIFLLNFQYALSHEKGYGLAFTISLLLVGSIVGGMVVGSKRWNHWKLQLIIPHIAGAVIVFVGLIKILYN